MRPKSESRHRDIDVTPASLQDLQKVVQLLQGDFDFRYPSDERECRSIDSTSEMSGEAFDPQKIGQVSGLVGSLHLSRPLLDPLSPVEFDILKQELAARNNRARKRSVSTGGQGMNRRSFGVQRVDDRSECRVRVIQRDKLDRSVSQLQHQLRFVASLFTHGGEDLLSRDVDARMFEEPGERGVQLPLNLHRQVSHPPQFDNTGQQPPFQVFPT